MSLPVCSPVRIGLFACLLAAGFFSKPQHAAADDATARSDSPQALLDANLSHWQTTGAWQVSADAPITVQLTKPKNRGFQLFPDYKAFLWSKEAYADFDLSFEFKLPKDGRSGLFFRSRSLNNYHEIQLADSHGNANRLRDTDCGGLVDVKAPLSQACRPPGNWNHMRLRVLGSQVSVTLNDTLVLETQLKDVASDAEKRKGRIAIQDQGHLIEIRRMEITPL
ncbi:MAG: DUF1080 domain-containing protein [Planctomycetota bacterium]